MNQSQPDLIAVLIVEDEPIFRDGLRGYLEARKDIIAVIGETDSGIDAVRLVESKVPDIVLMDLILHHDDQAGINAISEIKAASPTTQVLVLTAHAEDALVFPAIKAGAVGYLLKDNLSGRELVDRIQDVYRGFPPLDPLIAQKLMSFFQEQPLLGHEESLAVRNGLTLREEEVLEQIAQRRSNKEIAKSLGIAEKTVKTHVSNILHKLHLANRAEAAMYARIRNAKLKQDSTQIPPSGTFPGLRTGS